MFVDPLAEKYPGIGGYVYVANNTINLIDPDGRDIVIHYFDNWGAKRTWKFNGKNSNEEPLNPFVGAFLDANYYNISNGGGDNMVYSAHDKLYDYNLE